MQFWGQIVSIAAMAIIIVSFQCKSTKMFVAVKGVGALLSVISFFLLGNPVSAVFNLIAFVWSFISLNAKWKNKYTFIFFTVLYLIATLITFEKTLSFVSLWAFLFMFVQIADLYSVIFGDGKLIRNMRLFLISPAWLINNTVIVFSIGGALCEVFIMVSVIVSFVRFRKTGFEQ